MRVLLPVVFFLIAAGGMFAFLLAQPAISPSYGLPILLAGIATIILFSWAGLFEKSIITYAIFSTVIQAAYFLLDVGSAILIGKSVWFAVIQAINFAIAGGLFILVFALLYLSLKKELLTDYVGLYEKNRFLVIALALGCLSLGGMPGFNIFVGEFLLYSFLFSVHPSLALAAILAGLVCFLFYFRICYTLMVRKSSSRIRVPLAAKAAAAALAILVVGLGVVPQLLLRVLEVVP